MAGPFATPKEALDDLFAPYMTPGLRPIRSRSRPAPIPDPHPPSKKAKLAPQPRRHACKTLTVEEEQAYCARLEQLLLNHPQYENRVSREFTLLSNVLSLPSAHRLVSTQVCDAVKQVAQLYTYYWEYIVQEGLDPQTTVYHPRIHVKKSE